MMRDVGVPSDEIRVNRRHDVLLVHDVFLLPRLNDVVLLHLLQRKRSTQISLQPDLIMNTVFAEILVQASRPAEDFSLVARLKGRRPRAGVRLSGRGINPLPPATEPEEALWAPSAGFGAETRPPKCFPLFPCSEWPLDWHYNTVNCGLLCSHWGHHPVPPTCVCIGLAWLGCKWCSVNPHIIICTFTLIFLRCRHQLQ